MVKNFINDMANIAYSAYYRAVSPEWLRNLNKQVAYSSKTHRFIAGVSYATGMSPEEAARMASEVCGEMQHYVGKCEDIYQAALKERALDEVKDMFIAMLNK